MNKLVGAAAAVIANVNAAGRGVAGNGSALRLSAGKNDFTRSIVVESGFPVNIDACSGRTGSHINRSGIFNRTAVDGLHPVRSGRSSFNVNGTEVNGAGMRSVGIHADTAVAVDGDDTARRIGDCRIYRCRGCNHAFAAVDGNGAAVDSIRSGGRCSVCRHAVSAAGRGN